MSEYSNVKSGTLKLKGKKNIFRVKSKKSGKGDAEALVDHDAIEHGGWWLIREDVDLKGGIHVSLEVGASKGCYLAAMDNGKFTIGAPHPDGEPPNPEEVFAFIRTSDEQKFSLKTGFGKYIGVDTAGQLIATAEAIGARERFIAVFQDGKSAVQSVMNPLFLTMMPDREGYIFVASRTAGDNEIVNIRTDAEKQKPIDYIPDDDRKSAGECETSYVKMFQHSKVDLKNRMVSVDVNDKKGVKRAQRDGDLHEHLLERRKKTKSDRYC
ncbi:unnamed protein product, partial [Mesorhabditis spiculigera]